MSVAVAPLGTNAHVVSTTSDWLGYAASLGHRAAG